MADELAVFNFCYFYIMVEELRKALDKAKQLPENQQRALAELILNEIEWESSFQSSPEKLSSLAKEALSEYKDGKTKPLDV
jgi:hypothetical protein